MATAPSLASARASSLRQFQLHGVRDTGIIVGTGSYANVKELEFHGLKCVGKKIHQVLFDAALPQERAAMLQRFTEECELLGHLHHPCVVQFLGVYFEHGSRLPVLVMEFLHATLSDSITRYGVLPEAISYGILRDVALGLRYLHEQSPAIIHRDLSANNVLLTSSMSAKISDLGVAKILNLTPAQMTQAPGTPCYMPPEAIIAKPTYNSSIDSYAYGVMMIHVFCGRWPFPADSFRRDPQNPEALLPVSEVDRRAEYLRDISQTHPLMGLVHQCLSNAPTHRPEASEILRQITDVMSRIPETHRNEIEKLQHWESRVQDKESQIESLTAQNQALHSQIESLTAQIQTLQSQLEVKNQAKFEAPRTAVKWLSVPSPQTDLEVEGRSRQDSQPQLQPRLQLRSRPYLLPRPLSLLRFQPSSLPLPRSPSQVQPSPQPPPRSPSQAQPSPQPPPRSPSQAQPSPQPPPRSPSQAQPSPQPLPRSPSQAQPSPQPPPRLPSQTQLSPQPPPRSPSQTQLSPQPPPRSPSPQPPPRSPSQAQPSPQPLPRSLSQTQLSPQPLPRSRNQPTTLPRRPRRPRPRSQYIESQPILHAQAKLHWSKVSNLPVEMSRPQVVVVGEKMCVGGGVTGGVDDNCLVFQYTPATNRWSTLAHSPVVLFGLGQLSGELLTVGGSARDGICNKVYHYKPDSQEWKEFLQPMPTARACLTVISTESALISCGGVTGRRQHKPVPCTEVEVYATETSRWHTADPLPIPCWSMSSATISNTGYLLGGWTTDNKPTNTALCASIASLTQKATSHPQQSAGARPLQPNSASSAWKILKDTPLMESAAAKLGGMLLAVGGRNDQKETHPTVYVYSPATSAWIRIESGDLPETQHSCTAIELSVNELLVMGGRSNDRKKNTVFLGSLAIGTCN